MTPVELEAALDQVLRGDQGAAQRIIEHNKRLELINYDYRIGNTSLTASCHSFDMQVAELTWKLELRTQELDRIVQEQSHTYAVEMPDLQEQLTNLTASCLSFDLQVAELTAQLATVTKELQEEKIQHLEKCKELWHQQQQLAQAQQERDEALRLSRFAVHEALLHSGHTVAEHTGNVFGQWQQAIQDAIKAEQQLADLTAKLAQKQAECDEHVENLSRCKGNELAQQLAQAKQDLADLPTLRKDLSMCLIQLQEARGRILSMESEVDMVRAQLFSSPA